jgi:hypothetical protein
MGTIPAKYTWPVPSEMALNKVEAKEVLMCRLSWMLYGPCFDVSTDLNKTRRTYWEKPSMQA